MATTTDAPPQETPRTEKHPWYRARLCLGMEFTALMRLLVRNRFRVSPALAGNVAIELGWSVFNTTLRGVQSAVLGRRVARTELVEDPLFIIGHWRTGTTLLHELFVLDERFTYPNSYECFVPNHFLLTEGFLPRWFGFLIPDKRPMDNMGMSWERPQEDEFALCNLGVRSPYCTIAFPNEPVHYPEYFDLEDVSPAERKRWQRTLLGFLKQITYRRPRRIVLKSPPHTFRLKVLEEQFPRAQYVNIVRNPYVVFASTVNLWKRLYAYYGLQKPNYEGLEEHVFETFARMHDKLEETRGLVDPERLYDIRYEDLIEDPIGNMRAIYEHLGLGGFDEVEPKIAQYFAERGDYRTNRYDLDPALRERISERWGGYIEKYGY